MSLFGFIKKKKEDKTNCCCNRGLNDKNKSVSNCCDNLIDNICSIKVLGVGCKSCNELFENTKTAIKNMGLNVEVEYITDLKIVAQYGVMTMPALIVNENVVSVGKVYKSADIENLLIKLTK